ncbi:aspartic peptidase domain-containing protein [Amylocystis lapponica]|nr:aspartic peptidase domain-containing protein [Amylocystis lapponica]
MLYFALLSPFLLSSFLSPIAAINIPFRRDVSRRQNANAHSMGMSKAGVSSSLNEVAGFNNIENLRYVGNITVFNTPITVILDTGSNDLWISTQGLSFGDAPVTNTSITAELDYGVAGEYSSDKGFVLLSRVQFSDFALDNLAFIDVTTAANDLPGISGLLGLGPPLEESITASQISGAGYDGSTALEKIFAEYDVPQQFTMLMYRDNGTGETVGGEMTIGIPLDEYSDIEHQPQLPIVDAPLGGRTHWSVPIDAVKVNGVWYNETATGATNLTAVLDSGTPTAFIDPFFVKAIYGDDVTYANGGDAPNAPCGLQANISFVIGGVEMPIDPIDVVTPYNYMHGQVTCTGAFNSIGNSTPGMFLLGDTFMRNVYTLHNFNNWTKAGDPLPYTQLLPVTNADNAYATFSDRNQERLSAFKASNTNSSDSNSNSTSNSDSDSDSSDLSVGGALADASATPAVVSSADWSALQRNTYIIIGLAGSAVLLLIVIAIMLVRQRSQAAGYRVLGAGRGGAPPGMSEHRPMFEDAAYQD